MSDIAALVDHLFRREAGKMVATLIRALGPRNVEMAEDVVQDALCRALETWKFHGVPEDPTSWLFQTARHRALDLFRRRKLFDRSSRRIAERLGSRVREKEIQDDQLRLMFMGAHPSAPVEGQVAVILKYLCGFSVGEIARTFLTSHAVVEKRLARAIRVMKCMGGNLELPDARGLAKRLDSVHQALYLLFNEGYHGSHPERSVREELCAEAMRLGSLLAENKATATSATFALLGMMSLHAARLPARMDDAGSLILLEAQDRSRWSRPLLEQGYRYLARSTGGTEITPFHLEAGIAALHAQACTFEETDWKSILRLYTLLYRLRPTPVVALNRAIAMGRVEGPDRALKELARIGRARELKSYPFVEAAEGDLYERAGKMEAARSHYRRALSLARNESERKVIQSRLVALS